ncbi:Nn.00g027510.m01.CDS01 [Neocucurbitaria sp. VM-36]
MSASTPSISRSTSVSAVQGAPGQRNTTGGLPHMRTLGLRHRAWLVHGTVVDFVDNQGQGIMEGSKVLQMPRPLFEAVSSKPELVVEGKIAIAADLHIPSVKFLVACMNSLVSRPRVNDLSIRNDTFRDVQLCSAADALGMGTFTQRIFDTYFKRFNSVVPTAANIDAITSIRTHQGNKLFSQMAHTIAKKLWENEFKNGEGFKQHYLPSNPRLADAISEWMAKFEQKATRQADYEKRQAARLERERKAAEADQRNKERLAEAAALKKGKELAIAKKLAEQEAKEKVAGASYREKKRNGVKVFTFAEARYAWKYDGVRVPVKGT